MLRSLLLIGLLLAQSASTQNRYFRENGGVVEKAGALPSHFDDPKTLHWRQSLDSGHSSPIVHDQSIFLTTYNTERRELALVALDLGTGKEKWKRIAPADRIESTHPTGNPAATTPACDGHHVYVLFGSYGLLCYDLNGTEIWKRPLGPFRDEYGAGSSPILVDHKIIVSEDHDVDSFIQAFDARNGQALWKTSRPDAVRSYATPAVYLHGGRKEILVPGALQLTSYDADNGSVLWWVDGLARIVIPAPVAVDQMIYVASWAPGGDTGSRIALDAWKQAVTKWDANKDDKLAKAEISDQEVLSRFFRMDLDQSGALDQSEWERHASVFQKAQNAVLAIQPDGRGDLTETAIKWKYPKGSPYVASPAVHDGILWMVKDGGLVTKLDSSTGQLLHQERLPALGSYYASPVCADGKVYFGSEKGVVTVVADAREWKVISSHDFHERIYATPAVVKSEILIRTEAALYCFRENH